MPPNSRPRPPTLWSGAEAGPTSELGFAVERGARGTTSLLPFSAAGAPLPLGLHAQLPDLRPEV